MQKLLDDPYNDDESVNSVSVFDDMKKFLDKKQGLKKLYCNDPEIQHNKKKKKGGF